MSLPNSNPTASVSKQESYHVLLIEDDPKQSELYAELIRQVEDCKVDVMSRMDHSLEWIAKSNYNLVVIDSNSSGGTTSGFTLLEQIKRISPVTSVILMSEKATVEQAVSAIRLGAEDYLKKPFNLENFQLAVKRGLDRKAVYDVNTGASSFLNLLNCCQMISAALEEKRVFNMIQGYFVRELNCAYTSLYQLNPKGEVSRLDSKPKEGYMDRAMHEVLDIAVQATNPFAPLIDSTESYRFIERSQLTPGLFIFKFQCVGPTYFLVCLSPEPPNSLDDFNSRIRLLKTQIEVTGRNIAHYIGVHKLVYLDDATGLYNTRYLNYILDREITQFQTTKKSFAVLFVDADKFKKINDTHGHLIGTKILNELGSLIRKQVRDTDTVFRYGGDEFVAVLSQCDLQTAKNVAERIRAMVEKEKFIESDGLNLSMTVSIGVALFPDHANSKQAIIEAADYAMYASKRSTRNSVTLAEAPHAQPPPEDLQNNENASEKKSS